MSVLKSLFAEYPEPPLEGYWGVGDATIDWCEENYVVSHYMAEALNTLTNFLFVVMGIHAMYSCWRNKFEIRFFLMSFGFTLVGVGSWMFHMTLWYKYQLLDELPMIYATCVPFWTVFSYGQSRRNSVAIAISVVLGAGLLTAIYLQFKDPTIHQVSYALLNVGIIFQSYVLTQRHVKDEKAKANLMRAMVTGICTFLFGYFLWNLDIHLCQFLRRTRRIIGMPWGFLLEGHAWWHIFTGAGVYFYLNYLEYLRCFLIHTEDRYEFSWKLNIIPFITLKDNIDTEGEKKEK